MPELPEVETIRRGLEKYVVGHAILGVEVRLARIFFGEVSDIIGAKIVGARRFGKGLIIDLDNGFSIAVHVKMTGQLIYDAGPVELLSRPTSSHSLRALDGSPSPLATRLYSNNKHTHVILKIKDQRSKIKKTNKNSKSFAYLYYNDIRQFGWIRILPTSDVLGLPFFKSLGREPLKDLTFKKFQLLLKAKTQIKSLLMDQKKIAGIGNIYANDALYIARIHPKRLASSLLENEQRELFKAVEDVLQKGIEAGGASEWNYVDVLGGKGKYQNFFQVYQKDGKPCKRCGSIVKKIVVGGRGTFFCPMCQPSP